MIKYHTFLNIEFSDNICIVYWIGIDMFGYGDTFIEALIDFWKTVDQYHMYLRKRIKNLGKIPLEDLKCLNETLTLL